ncbi:MAG: TraE family protein [Agathobaculum sp.]|uniref:VirB4-like conjugal transfer ATPase, CD1110 family n=1 Tax=Agathobaculum sp. TaxID=2048138 RepID=UPI002A831E6B|nr:TraE family protein [Agathobaculum sp.]MDY3712004.1 TraE family protein [Agathobaculum sp.]
MLKHKKQAKPARPVRPVRLPRSTQQLIPVRRVFPDAIWQLGAREYSKTWSFSDINYAVASIDDQTTILDGWGRVLNGLAADSRLKITLANRLFDKDSFAGTVFLKKKDDGLDKYRAEINRILMDIAKGSNGIVQEKFLTLTTSRKNIEEARAFFARAGKGLSIGMQRLSSALHELDNTERFRILHEFFRTGHRMTRADTDELMRRGQHFADIFAPLALRYHKDYIETDNGFARVLFVEEYASRLSDELVQGLMALPRQMVLSIDIEPVNTQETGKMLQNLAMRVESDVTRWQGRQNKRNNFSAEIPYELRQMREMVNEYMEDTTRNDQRIMLTTTTILHMADTLEQLNADTETLQSTAGGFGCTLSVLKFQQDIGLDTVLPYGLRRVVQQRTLLTKSASILTPFSVQEVQQSGGICYGSNAVSGNMIIANRALLANGNGIRLGISGAGKSMSAKQEIVQILLSTDDDVLILDPEGEFTPMVGAFGGAMIDVSASSAVRINALDMERGYVDEGKDPIADKTEFVLSLFEQIMGKDLNARHRSIIGRCIQNMYEPYIKNGYQGAPPTLTDLQRELKRQEEDEARDLMLSAELFISGSLGVFSKHTNVDQHNRLTSYNILDLGEQLMPLGMLVILESVYNRVLRNWRAGKRTWVFVDEFSIFFRFDYSSQFFLRMWKQVRKRAGYMTGITQNIGEMLLNEQARWMLANSEFIIMLSQSASDRAALAELLHISDTQLSYVDNAKRGCGLMKFGGAFIPFNNDFPKNTELYSLMTTKPGEWRQ